MSYFEQARDFYKSEEIRKAHHNALAGHLAFQIDEAVNDVIADYAKRALVGDFKAALDRDINAHRREVIVAVCKFKDSQVARLITHDALMRVDPTNAKESN